MKDSFKWILLLAIWNSILFYGKDLGLSVILFTVPLILFLVYTLKKQNLIKNKSGLLFIIPIIILSLTYLLYHNTTFYYLNSLVITGLFILMYIFTIKPTYDLSDILNNGVAVVIEPLTCIGKVFHLLFNNKKEKKNNKNKKIAKEVLIAIPVIIIVLILLASADMMFANLFRGITNIFNNIEISDFILELIFRIIAAIVLFIYLSATINYLLFNFKKTKYHNTNIELDNITIKVLLISLNIIYIVFDIIQIRSLLLHKVSMDITYAEYARQGFFQLVLVSIINFIIILLSKNNKDKKDNKIFKILSIIMVFLTSIIIVSAFARMHMYEVAYGYTLLRLLVYIFLITEMILLIPTIIYILKDKFNIVKYYMIICITIYTIISLFNFDGIIAKENIARYKETNKIDIQYLENYGTDNYLLLLNLYNNTKDEELRKELSSYFDNLDKEINGFQEFNISQHVAKKEIITTT